MSLVPKIKFEHLNLTSFSKMRVDLVPGKFNVITFSYYVVFFLAFFITPGTQ